MEAMTSFCRYCLDDSGTGFKSRRAVETKSGKRSWECVDYEACLARCAENEREAQEERAALASAAPEEKS